MQRGAVATVAVTVNNQAWTRVFSFRNAGPDDAVYVLDRKGGYIKFGDGTHGRIPQVGDVIGASYRDGAGSSGNISKRIDNEQQVSRFWVVVRSRQQAIGWGKRPC